MLKDRLNKIIHGGMVKKFIILTVIIIVLLDILAAILMQMEMDRTLSGELNEKGGVISRHIAEESVVPLSKNDTVSLLKIVESFQMTEGDVKYAYITDAEGNVIVHTPGNNSRYISDYKAPILEGRAGFVHVGLDRTDINEKIAGMNRISIADILLEGALGILMAYMAGNYLARPVRSLVKGAEEIGKGNLGYKIEPGSTDDEIQALSNAFNQMSYNLNRSISELRASEIRYRKLVDGISDAVLLIDSQRIIRSWNTAAQNIFGWSADEVIGKKTDALLAGTDEWKMVNGEEYFIKKNGLMFPGIMRTKLLQEGSYVVVIRDATDLKEMKRLEMQLLQADKLATIGQLAAGIAHEINNPLGNISLYTQMLLKKTEDETTKEKLMIINDEANRAAQIVNWLLDFARQSEIKLSHIDINKEISKVLNILSPMLKDIKVSTAFEPLPLILADPGQIQQVLMNLITNSIQSITENGEIMVKTTAEQDYVEISISDNGCGILQENINKIFDPFFTTKEQGEGTGLGLSICYGIIKRHNGSIEVISDVGAGTTFTIKLPA